MNVSTSAPNNLDAVMSQIIENLRKFGDAIQKVTDATTSGASPTTLQALLGSAQSAAFSVNGAASGASAQGTTTAALGGLGGVPGAPGLITSGGNKGALVQGSAAVPFGGGQSPLPGNTATGGSSAQADQTYNRDASGRFVSAGAGSSSIFGSGSSPAFGGGMARAGIHFAANATTQMFEMGTQQQLSGRTNVIDTARAYGMALGAIAGAPFGTTAMGIGATVGGAALGYFAAPLQNRINSIDELRILHDTVGTRAQGGLDSFSLNARAARMGEIKRGFERGPDPFGFSEADVSRGYTSAASGMLLGGLDPYQKWGSRVYGPTAAELLEHRNNLSGNIGKSAQQMLDYGRDSIRMMGAGREEYAEAITRRAFKRYRNEGADVLKNVGQIYAGIPETGDNLVDSIVKYGPIKTLEFERLQTEDGKLPIGEGDFFRISADMRRSGLNVRRAGLQARGKGQGVSDVLSGEMARLAAVPGGKNSTTYLELQAQARDAGRQAFDEKSITSFGIPETKLEGQLARADIAPFSPTNIYRLSLQHINLNQKRVGDLTDYMKKRKASGQLSETEEQDLVGQIEQAKTSTTQDQSRLSEGILQRLPAMLSGGGQFQARYTSPMLATMALRQMGNNTVRAFGAADGKHLAAQNEEYADVQGDTPTRAGSRSAALNNVTGDRSSGLAETNALLRQLIQAVSGSGGKKSGRADEVLSSLQAMIKRTTSEGGGGDGSGGSFN